MVDEILFGSGSWPPDPQTVWEELAALGLEKRLNPIRAQFSRQLWAVPRRSICFRYSWGIR